MKYKIVILLFQLNPNAGGKLWRSVLDLQQEISRYYLAHDCDDIVMQTSELPAGTSCRTKYVGPPTFTQETAPASRCHALAFLWFIAQPDPRCSVVDGTTHDDIVNVLSPPRRNTSNCGVVDGTLTFRLDIYHFCATILTPCAYSQVTAPRC